MLPSARQNDRWKGATVVCIASGPSLTREDCALVDDWHEGSARRVIAVNLSHRLAPYADVVYGMDRGFWNEHAAELRDSRAELWTTNREAAHVHRLRHIAGHPIGGISPRPGHIAMGGNSGYQAVALAIHFGAARVVLLGYDMRNEGRRTHWHGNHVRLGNPAPTRFGEWIRHFDTLKRQMPAGVSVINATPDSALRTFPYVALREALLTTPSIASSIAACHHKEPR